MRFKRTVVIFILMIMMLVFSACNKESNQEPINIILSGDIEGHFANINLSNLNQQAFNDDNTEYKGYKLSEVLDLINVLNNDYWILLTASDKVSAKIDGSTIHLVYIIVENGSLTIKAPSHPRLVGIKDLIEITVISKDHIDDGLRLVNEDNTSIISYGNVKLMLFDEVAENYKFEIVAYKYMPKESLSVKDITSFNDNILYFENNDIIKGSVSGKIIWLNGKLTYQLENTLYESIYGIVSQTETVLFDAYYTMKSALDSGERVMFILPDGLSLQQVKHYADDLTLFKDNYTIAASVNPAISNVALASIITGISPYNNGIVQRGIKAPACSDIFDYALSLNKTVKYIEGNGNLLITSVPPILNAADANGFTDTNVFNSAIRALEDDPDLIFIHFHGIDDVNHAYSPISIEAKNQIIKIENYVLQLIAAFEGTVIILSDHGAITYYDNDNIAMGKHGVFHTNDMLVPFYVFN